MKCFVCKTGNMVLSGCHEYCDNCNFSRFVVTDDYIDSCIKVLATLVSNTKFNESRDAAVFVHNQIRDHLPKLFMFMTSVEADLQRLSDEIIQQTFTQAVNLQIGDETVGEVETKDNLICQCGHDDFTMINPATLACNNCGAWYLMNKEKGRYEPRFLCECGWAAYEVLDDKSGLIACTNCGKAYIHNVPNDTFMEVE